MDNKTKHRLIHSAIKEMIADGISIEIPVHGLSMFPTYLPGDIVKVNPITNDNIKIGDAVFFERDNKIVFHRLVKIDKNKGLYLTKGDGLYHYDETFSKEKLLAISVLHKRKGRILKYRNTKLIKNIIVIVTPLMGYITFFLARIWYKLNK